MIRKTQGRALAREAIATGNPVLADLAVDLYVPPLGQLVTALTVGFAAAAATGFGGRRQRAVYVHGIGLVGVVVHVGKAWQASGTGLGGLVDLARAPGYVAWKLIRRLRQTVGQREAIPTNWVRTARSGENIDAVINEGAL